MTAYGLTPRLAELLAFIERYTAEHGYAPTYREMGDATGDRSTGAIHRKLHALQDRGHVRFIYHKGRSVVAVEHLTHG